MAKQRTHEYYFKQVDNNGNWEPSYGHIVIKAISKAEAVNIAKGFDPTLVYDFMF